MKKFHHTTLASFEITVTHATFKTLCGEAFGLIGGDQDDRENWRSQRQRGKPLNLRLDGGGATPERGPSPELRFLSFAGQLNDMVKILSWENLVQK